MWIDFEHRHYCASCDLVWEHDPGNAAGRPASRFLSHTCPGCGSPEVLIYEGPKPVNVSHYSSRVRIALEARRGQTVGAGI